MPDPVSNCLLLLAGTLHCNRSHFPVHCLHAVHDCLSIPPDHDLRLRLKYSTEIRLRFNEELQYQNLFCWQSSHFFGGLSHSVEVSKYGRILILRMKDLLYREVNVFLYRQYLTDKSIHALGRWKQAHHCVHASRIFAPCRVAPRQQNVNHLPGISNLRKLCGSVSNLQLNSQHPQPA